MNGIAKIRIFPVIIMGLIFALTNACQKEYEKVELPTVIIDSLISYTTTSLTLKITVDEGNLNVLSRGVCWALHSNPTIDDNFTSDGSGPGSFISYLTGLPSQNSYLRAYAITDIGTAYGSLFLFDGNYN